MKALTLGFSRRARGGRTTYPEIPTDLGASALILVHNHPSGDPTPSGKDIAMTQEIIFRRVEPSPVLSKARIRPRRSG
jgi:hypothetical protein